MNETETRSEYIDPALKAAGWGVVEGSRIRMEFPIPIYVNDVKNQGLYGFTNEARVNKPAVSFAARGSGTVEELKKSILQKAMTGEFVESQGELRSGEPAESETEKAIGINER